MTASLGERTLRRTAWFAAAVWMAAYLVRGLTTTRTADRAGLHLLAIALWLVGSLLVLRPRGGSARAGAAVELAAATALPLASLLVLVSLPAAATASYANWVVGGSAVVLCGLVLRGREALALGCGVAVLTAQSAVALARQTEATAFDMARLSVPVLIWLVGSWLVRRHLDRAEQLAVELRTQRALVGTERVLAERWGELRTRQYAELEDEVMPLMRQLVSLPTGADLPAAERARAGDVAAHLRDVLHARSLMSRDLRRVVQRARDDGIRVMLHNGLDDGAAVRALRDLVGELLVLPGLVLFSVRTFVDPGQATLVLRGDQRFAEEGLAAVTAVVGTRTTYWSETTIVDLDGDVMVQLSGPHADEPALGRSRAAARP